VREQAFFESAEKDQGKLQALGRMQAHQRNLRALVIVVGVGDEGSVVEELIERLAAVTGVGGRVHQFAQVFDAREGFRRVLGFEKPDVAGAVDEELEQSAVVTAASGWPEGGRDALSCSGTIAGGTPALLSGSASW